MGRKLQTSHLPEMIFGDSSLILKHISSGTKVHFNAYDALVGWKKDALPPVEVPVAAQWKFRSLTVCVSHYFIPYSFGAAARTRVSNELGSGNPQAAKTALLVASTIGAVEGIIAITTLLCSRSVLGYAFGNDEELVDYVKDITLLVCFTMFSDTIQAILQGVARGTGLQHIGACINLGSYYLAGIPMALILGFIVHLKAKGLWGGGLITGSIVQCSLLTLVTCSTNWEKQAKKARERVFVEEHIEEE